MAYVKYFFYLAWNWNLQLAFFIIYYEIWGEKKYKQKTIGTDDLKKSIPEEQRLHASIYQPINYYTAQKLFDQISPQDRMGVLLDMGCGKGRIFGIGRVYGFKNMFGIDFSTTLCMLAQQNATKVQSINRDINIEVICADVGEYAIPKSVTILFLFNPFDDFIMRKMLQRLKESLAIAPRSIKILYANPIHKQSIIEAGFVEIYYFKKMKYLEGSILEKSV